ncbi:MAG: SGNH/GDSL hydrolase family protein, partial [Verrucomicrobiota bacterium]|nr:SGNH/GDSL hydrolase family protein [Verrucomicrobiota bacterium]
TTGSACDCPNYPQRLASLIGKTVYNEGRGGSQAIRSVDKTKEVIDEHKAGFMLLLYGINDVIHSRNTDSILKALESMVQICKDNNVVAVISTYPVPIWGHRIFAAGTVRLNEGIRQLARAHGIRCVDLEYEFSNGRDPANANLPRADESLYDPDGLHPNDAGTQIIAMAFADLF